MSDVHICIGVGKMYQARARRLGCRNWILIGEPTTSYDEAVIDMATAFAAHDYKRADVIMCADYYEPIRVCELVRK